MGENEIRASIRRWIATLAALEPSKAAFARKVGSTPQNVTHWTSGEKIPAIETIVHIADVYDMSVDTLFGRPVKKSTLSPDEDEVLEALRTMNADGRRALVAVARGLKASGEYDA